VTVGRALSEATGAGYVPSAKAEIAVPFKGVEDGDDIPLAILSSRAFP
jgi:hydroxyacylglutathione hydrolase